MRIQTKLFVLLLIIAILPLGALTWRSQRATENLGQAIAAHGKEAVIQEIEAQLRQAVGYSSDLLASQRRQVELALRLQAAEAERRLAAPATAGAAPRTYMSSDFDSPQTWPPGTELALDHAVTTPGREVQPVPISRDHQSFFLTPDADREVVRESMQRLTAMDIFYSRLNDSNPGLFYWQYVSLKEGVHASYPGHGGYPAGYDPRVRSWYQAAAVADDPVWTLPLLDASTRRLLLTSAMSVRGPGRAFAGVTGIDVDILAVLNGVHGRLRLGTNAESHIVQLVGADGQVYQPGVTGGHPTLRVVASSTYRDSGASWDAQLQAPALVSATPADTDGVIADLMADREGIRHMPHENRDALWVYGPIQGLGAALLYIVPVDEIESVADQAQTSVRKAIFDQVRLAGIASVALTILVAVLAMLAARSVTGPLRDLAATAQGLAQGNLEARALVQSSDEVGELADVFNAMVPELRNHIQVKESLTLAREVQQKLLPQSAPQVPGFDIAGRSIYSEVVGGDYFDFMELSDDAGERRIGIAVGDVAGHGIVAALTMTSVRVLLRSHAGDAHGLRPVMRAVNRHLADDAAAGRFVTLVYLVLEPDTREVRWINAGHGPVMVYDPSADSFEEIAVNDIPLGVNADWQFQEYSRRDWPASAVVVVGTDGIWETANPEGGLFGKDGLKQVIRSKAHLSAADICVSVTAQLEEFADGVPQRDDVTLVVVKFPP